MKNIKRLRRAAVLLVCLATSGTGCSTMQEAKTAYQKCPYTPDSVNYTAARDRSTGDWTDYWGCSWNLK